MDKKIVCLSITLNIMVTPEGDRPVPDIEKQVEQHFDNLGGLALTRRGRLSTNRTRMMTRGSLTAGVALVLGTILAITTGGGQTEPSNPPGISHAEGVKGPFGADRRVHNLGTVYTSPKAPKGQAK